MPKYDVRYSTTVEAFDETDAAREAMSRLDWSQEYWFEVTRVDDSPITERIQVKRGFFQRLKARMADGIF